MVKKTPRTFIKHIDGEDVVMPAYGEADAVRLIYNGWREITADLERGAAAAAEAAEPAPKKATGKADSAR